MIILGSYSEAEEQMLEKRGPSTLDQPILSELQAMMEELKAAYASFAAGKRGKTYLNVSDAQFTTWIGVTRPAYSQQMLGYNKPSLEALMKFYSAFKRLFPGEEGDQKAHKYLELLDREDYIDLCEAYHLHRHDLRFQYLLRHWEGLDTETMEDIVNVVRSKQAPTGGGEESEPPD